MFQLSEVTLHKPTDITRMREQAISPSFFVGIICQAKKNSFIKSFSPVKIYIIVGTTLFSFWQYNFEIDASLHMGRELLYDMRGNCSAGGVREERVGDGVKGCCL